MDTLVTSHSPVSALEAYVRSAAPPRLHIGCGENTKEGWLNCDMEPPNERVYPLDVRQRFPFGNNSFDYIYSEHMIEHMRYSEGLSMLFECNRVLKLGGVIRVVTPSISFLINLFSHDRRQIETRYIEWQVKNSCHEAPLPLPSFVFNSFVRNWGHTFIYDRETLRLSLQGAGFIDIRECNISESEHAMLQDLENVSRLPAGFLELESMIMEGTRAG